MGYAGIISEETSGVVGVTGDCAVSRAFLDGSFIESAEQTAYTLGSSVRGDGSAHVYVAACAWLAGRAAITSDDTACALFPSRYGRIFELEVIYASVEYTKEA